MAFAESGQVLAVQAGPAGGEEGAGAEEGVGGLGVVGEPGAGEVGEAALGAGLAFGVGVGIVNSLWGDCDWGGGDVDIDVNKYNNINRNRQINRNQNKFVHNPINRQGVPYRDNINRQQNGLRLSGAEKRESLRGYDAQRTAQRQQARQSLEDWRFLMSRHGSA